MPPGRSTDECGALDESDFRIKVCADVFINRDETKESILEDRINAT